MADAYFSNVSLLLPLDGSAAATTFRDYSNTHHVVTTAGGVIAKPVGKYNGSAAYFDGTGDYLTLDGSAEFAFGTDDLTVEFWLWMTSVSTAYTLIDLRPTTTTGLYPVISTTAGGNLVFASNEVDRISAAHGIAASTWCHVALCRSGTSTKLFVNGAQIGSTYTNSDSYICGASRPAIGCSGYTLGATNFNGYLADLRITKGVARYTAAFPAPTDPLRHALDQNVVLRLTGEDLFDYSQTSVASTAYGSAAPSATQFKYGAKSLYFDGSGDYVTITSNAAFTFGTGDFTVEFWAYPTRDSVDETILDMRASDTTVPLYIGKTGASVARCYDGTTVRTGGTFPVNAWSHIAWVRSGTTNTIYIDGSSAISFTNAFNKAAAVITLGSNVLTSTENYQGYIDDLTITRRAKYTSAFERPVAQLPTETFVDEYLSSVSLQLNMDGADTSTTFTDTSPTPKTVTAVNAQIRTTQSRFGGSSAYFDGTGDYLTLTPDASLTFGTGDFTIEFWVYPSTLVPTYQGLIDFRTSNSGLSLIAFNNANLLFYTASTTAISAAGAVINTWQHVAISRANGITKLFLNGVQIGSNYTDANNYTVSTTLRIASSYDGYAFSGYIDDLRITKGVARYV